MISATGIRIFLKERPVFGDIIFIVYKEVGWGVELEGRNEAE